MADGVRESLVTLFDRCAPHLQAALAQSSEGFTLDDLRHEVVTGNALLWPGKDSAAVTYVRPLRAMHIWLAGGDMRELKDMSASLEHLSREHGCDAIMAGGREGWGRALRSLGYNSYVLKELG